MTIDELAKAIAKHEGMTQGAAYAALKAVTDTIHDLLIEGETVRLHRIGRFETVMMAEREYKAPIGGYRLVPSHKRLRFVQSPAFKKEIYGGIHR